jgi:hypothetical protein
MRAAVSSCLTLGALALLTQDAAAQLLDKKVLTLAPAQRTDVCRSRCGCSF